jgi:hypothetical protein
MSPPGVVAMGTLGLLFPLVKLHAHELGGPLVILPLSEPGRWA